MNKYADEVLEFLEGKRKLSNLPDVMKSTAQLLKNEMKQINTVFKNNL